MGKVSLEVMHRSRLGDDKVNVYSINQLPEAAVLEYGTSKGNGKVVDIYKALCTRLSDLQKY